MAWILFVFVQAPVVHSSSETLLMSKLDCCSYTGSMAEKERWRLHQMQLWYQITTVVENKTCKDCFCHSSSILIQGSFYLALLNSSSVLGIENIWLPYSKLRTVLACLCNINSFPRVPLFTLLELMSSVIENMWLLFSCTRVFPWKTDPNCPSQQPCLLCSLGNN